jgi:hypothetical protein
MNKEVFSDYANTYICDECVHPLKYKCCYHCLKIAPDGTMIPNKHWSPDGGCDLGEDRPKVCKEFKCEYCKKRLTQTN